jgi:uncharacterized protein
MSHFVAKDWVPLLFLRLKHRGYLLGVPEYQAAIEAVEAGYAQTESALIEMVQILWCHSRSQQSQLVPIWQDLYQLSRDQADLSTRYPDRADRDEQEIDRPERPQQEQESLDSDITETIVEPQPQPEVVSVPIQAPAFSPIDSEDMLSLRSYFPLSRRSMVYGWRFLQRLVTDGAKQALDIPATIRRVTDQGYYLEPVYGRRKRNCAELLLLVDQDGSMMPFHRFSRDLVETAREESLLQPENVRTFYFHNVPAEYVYKDIYLTQPIELKKVVAQCTNDTSVLVVSDAGAARGYRRQERIQETTRFLLQLRQRTALLAWLNPMSRQRWIGTSAEILAYLVPMFQMDRLGFVDAIDVLRGLTRAMEEEV